MTTSTRTALGGSPRQRIHTSGTQSTRVTSTARRRKSQRGAEEIRVVTGHAAQATTTPTTVKVA